MCHYNHFLEEEIEAQSGKITCPRSQEQNSKTMICTLICQAPKSVIFIHYNMLPFDAGFYLPLGSCLGLTLAILWMMKSHFCLVKL